MQMFARGKIIVNFENMPIFFQQDVDACTRFAIWEIMEEEAFFLSHVMPQTEVTHPHKRLQHLAGRYLLLYLFPDFPVSMVRIADTRKPYLEGEPFHFSISHSDNYAAAIVSRVNRVGIDVELITEKIGRVARKFIGEEEREMLHAQSSMLNDQNKGSQISEIESYTLVWCCKEAAFKWYGKGEVDFRDHMEIKSLVPTGKGKFDCIMEFRKEELLFLNLQTRFLKNVCLSYVVT
jgi:phosphopantetheinyl transferase